MFLQTSLPFKTAVRRAITVIIRWAFASLELLYSSEEGLLGIADSPDFVAFVISDYQGLLAEVP